MARLRFAPSPTGYLHVGGLRTALYSWLFARRNKGSFIFRLEDTDRSRLVEGAEEDLIRMLRWCGLDIDEGPDMGGDFGPYRQSERLELYHQYVRQLLDQEDAYPCFCSVERLEQLKKEQRDSGETPRYDRHCRGIYQDEARDRIESGEEHVIRMKIPDTGETFRLDDLLRGQVTIDSTQTEDQVLIKSDGFPTYHLAVVVDDHLMHISHVVRGEEWLPSFPKHLLLYHYLGWEPPRFVHLPLILNRDRSKLSKRQGDASVDDFRAQGYLPEALLNFIALLGWSPQDDRELFSVGELIDEFSFDRVSRSAAVFDRDKLNWMNQQYLQKISTEDYWKRLQPFIEETPYISKNPEKLHMAVEILKSRLVTLEQIGPRLSLFFDEQTEMPEEETLQALFSEESRKVLQAFIEEAQDLPELNAENLGSIVKAVQKSTGLKGRQLWVPLRCAITREVQGPDLPLMVEFFGKEKCLQLVRQALTMGVS